MAIKASKIRNSLKKGRLLVSFNDKEFEVVELFSKRVMMKGQDGSPYSASVQDLEFKAFIAND